MNQKINLQSWNQDFALFKEKTAAFHAGTISKKDYKSFSGKFGSYAQQDSAFHMLRLRLPAGRITKGKMNFIADVLKQYNIDLLHFTTCQTIQLHNLSLDVLYDIIERALDHDIVTLGGGGDYPRNVMCSPLSGVEKEEYFDVLPYAEAMSEYMMGFLNAEKLPRKLKIAFSNSPANITHATYRDLGFVARKNGRFDVYTAGGLGNGPAFGVKVAEAVAPEDVLYYAKAMWLTFCAYGNYENRAKARSRFMIERLGGVENYVTAYRAKLQEVFESGEDLQLEIRGAELVAGDGTSVARQGDAHKNGDGTHAIGPRIIPQKQDGLFAVFWHPIGGSPAPADFIALNDLIQEMDAVELRLDPGGACYVINLTGTEAKKILVATQHGAQSPFESSVACIGASICQHGIRDSQKLLRKCIHAVRDAQIPSDALPQIYISGCPSSCGTHQTGMLGFRGGVKMLDKVPHPAFQLTVGGSSLQGHEKMGTEAGMILESDIPEFLVELGKTVAASGMKFEEWYSADPTGVLRVAAPYAQ